MPPLGIARGVDLKYMRTEVVIGSPSSSRSLGAPDTEAIRRGVSPRLWAAIASRYAIAGELHVSGFSRVFRARQRSTGQEVAVKLLGANAGNAAPSREALERFRREARFCADLHHPNIVPLVDFGETEGDEAFAVFSFVP